MASHDFDLIVIGGGAAGLTVTAGAAQLGAKTLIIEREPALGGDCLHYGCVPSKTLIKTAHVRNQMRRARHFGLPPVDLPSVDFRQVAERIRNVIETIQPHDSVERFCGLGAQVVFGQAAFADEHTVRVDGTAYTGKQIVVATGSTAALPPVPGLDQLDPGDVLTNRELFSLEKLPESLIILGAGAIAVEMAQAFRRLGSEVRVIQRSGQILSREDRDMADLVLGEIWKDGIDFFLDTQVTGMRKENGRIAVDVVNAQGAALTLPGDKILVALGRTPDTGSLELANAGVDTDKRGAIPVDARMRTSQRHIFAAGDVTGAHQFTHAAGYEGGIVVANAIFHVPRKADYSLMPRATYCDPELACVGLNEKQARDQGMEPDKDYRVVTEPFADNDRAQAEGETAGMIKVLLDSKDRPLGVQIAGPHAGELLNEWVAVMGGRTKLSTLAGAVHPYPTLGEINKRVAGSVVSEKIFSDTVKTGLSFLFRFKGRACHLPPDSPEHTDKD